MYGTEGAPKGPGSAAGYRLMSWQTGLPFVK